MKFAVKKGEISNTYRYQARWILMNTEAALGLHDCVMERECDE